MSDDKPTVFVAGLARCGTTLMMTMLASAGMSTVGEPPGYEVDGINHAPATPEFMAEASGKAAKWLNPHEAPLPAGFDWVTIWLDRNTREQALSQAKFVSLVFGQPFPPRRQMRQWAVNLRRDRAIALRPVRERPWLRLTFEQLVTTPKVAAAAVTSFLRPFGFDLDIRALVAPVRARSPECQPGLDIELALIEAAQ